MTALTDDPVYALPEKRYPDMLPDCVPLPDAGAPAGKAEHKEAVPEALRIPGKRERAGRFHKRFRSEQ